MKFDIYMKCDHRQLEIEKVEPEISQIYSDALTTRLSL